MFPFFCFFFFTDINMRTFLFLYLSDFLLPISQTNFSTPAPLILVNLNHFYFKYQNFSCSSVLFEPFSNFLYINLFSLNSSFSLPTIQLSCLSFFVHYALLYILNKLQKMLISLRRAGYRKIEEISSMPPIFFKMFAPNQDSIQFSFDR